MTALLAEVNAADLYAAGDADGPVVGWHSIIACFGVGMPAIISTGKWRGHRTGDPVFKLLARCWARPWVSRSASAQCRANHLDRGAGPALMGVYGEVIGLLFSLEGIAFFIGPIFLCIYL